MTERHSRPRWPRPARRSRVAHADDPGATEEQRVERPQVSGGHAPHPTTGVARTSETHCQAGNCRTGTIASRITGAPNNADSCRRRRSASAGGREALSSGSGGTEVHLDRTNAGQLAELLADRTGAVPAGRPGHRVGRLGRRAGRPRPARPGPRRRPPRGVRPHPDPWTVLFGRRAGERLPRRHDPLPCRQSEGRPAGRDGRDPAGVSGGRLTQRHMTLPRSSRAASRSSRARATRERTVPIGQPQISATSA